MRFSAIILSTGALGPVAAYLTGDGNYRVSNPRARSSGDLIRLLARGLDEETAETLIERYHELELEMRSDKPSEKDIQKVIDKGGVAVDTAGLVNGRKSSGGKKSTAGGKKPKKAKRYKLKKRSDKPKTEDIGVPVDSTGIVVGISGGRKSSGGKKSPAGGKKPKKAKRHELKKRSNKPSAD